MIEIQNTEVCDIPYIKIFKQQILMYCMLPNWTRGYGTKEIIFNISMHCKTKMHSEVHQDHL